LGNIFKGWAITDEFFEHQSELAQAEKGIALIRQELSSLRQNGIDILIPVILVFLAESYGKIGRFEDGIQVVDEAKDLMQASGARFYEPEIHRLEGALKLSLADQRSEAETCFLNALRIARQQDAKSLELRTAVSLARLRQKQGDPDQGFDQLSEIYGWFTEGFDTPDLKEADTLLRKLSKEKSDHGI
jgi:predicted ATPase